MSGLVVIMGLALSTPALPKLVILGDSITASFGVDDARFTLAHQLQGRIPKYRVSSYAREGWTVAGYNSQTNGLGERVNWQATPPLYPAVVVVLLGVNDWAAGFDVADFETSYREMLGGLAAPGRKLYAVTPLWCRDENIPNHLGLVLEDYRDIIRRVSTGRALVLDGTDAVPHNEVFFRDGLHPNHRGSKLLAKWLAELIGG